MRMESPSPRGRPALFSICIPTYNRQEMLCQAIRSALNQSYDNIEVVVSDNASSDQTADMVAALNDQRIRYFRNPTNLGAAANWERCVQRASGDYFSWLQDDDLLLPNFVSAAVAALSATTAACCFGACLQTSTPSSMADASLFTTVMAVDWCDARPIAFPLSLAMPLAIFESSGIPPAMAFTTDAIRHVAPEICHTNYPLYAERMLIVRHAANGGVAILPVVGGVYRCHPGQHSRGMLIDSSSSRRQYQSFLSALDALRDLHAVGLDDFREFLSRAPDRVVERLYVSTRRIQSTSRLFLDTRECVIQEFHARDISGTKHRVWRLCRDLTPPCLARAFDGGVQRVARRLGIWPGGV